MRPTLRPRLYLRRRKGGPSVWVIRDGGQTLSTGFREPDQESAQQMLDAYCHDFNVVPGEPSTAPQFTRTGGWVYFLSCVCPGFPIKIGWASNVTSRIQALQCALPYKVVLLAATRGSMDDERRFHIGFRQYRLEGEWFTRNPDLMALIERCAVKEAA